jgi:hypothetical protein
MNTTIVDVVAHAVRLSLDSDFFSEYLRWSKAWLDGSDRSRGSAFSAKARANQWKAFAGSFHLVRALLLTADAAEQLAWSEIEREAYHAGEARKSALAAIREYGLVGTPEYDPGPREMPLIVPHRNYGELG